MLKSLISKLPNPLRSLAVRFDSSPIANSDQLTDFLQTRSAYVAQTSLYGYLKTRMGTSFRQYFEDDAFSQSIRVAAIKVYESCLADLTIFAVGLAASDADHPVAPQHARALACRCYEDALQRMLDSGDHIHISADAAQEFRHRVEGTDWGHAALRENAFSGSVRDLLRYAPVVDEFKELDGNIVSNSIRYRWQDVRRQLRKRLDLKGLASDRN